MDTPDDGTVSKPIEDAASKSTKTKITSQQGQGSLSGILSGKINKNNKAFSVLESQGIVVGKALGSGSYATVRSAYDINRKHKVAVKIINKKKAYDEYLNKFLPREIEAMRTLSSHYAVVKFYQIVETTSRYFFIMELAEKGDLLTEIKDKGHIAEPQAGTWFINLYDGLRYMHGKNLVHRDIKCENLVLDSKNILKLTDLGFAKKIGKAKSTSGPLLSETYCGSYAYAPPEILKGTPYNPEMSDVWSVGVVLFTMLYGKLPFDDSDHRKLLKQVQSRITFPSKPEVSRECRILMVKIFSKVSDRVPLKNIRADGWFKQHQALKTNSDEDNTELKQEMKTTDNETKKQTGLNHSSASDKVSKSVNS